MNVRWPAAVLAFLVAAGVVKSSAAMQWLPVDLTVLAAVAVTVGGLNSLAGIARHRTRMPIGWAMGAFAVGALGLVRWEGSDYARDKTLALFTLTLGRSFVGGLLLVRSPRQRDALAWATVGAGLLVAALATLAPVKNAALEGRVALAGAATIAPAQIVGAAAVVVLAFALTGRVRLLVALPLVAGLLVVMVSTGSRGPLVALVAAAAGLLLLLPTRRIRALAVLAVVAVVGARIFIGAAASTQDRILLLLADDKGASVTIRETMWRTAWEAVQLEPFGRGWGGLSPLLVPIGGDYPHNIVLEVAGEAGVLAAVALLVAVGVAIRRMAHAARAGDLSAHAMLALLVFWFVNALVSGDVNDDRGLFVLLGTALTVPPVASGDDLGGPDGVLAEGGTEPNAGARWR